MSWQSYIDQLMVPEKDGRQIILAAAICGAQPGTESVWASTPGFNVTPAELQHLNGDDQTLQQCGPRVGGVKCMMLQNNKDVEKVYSMSLKTTAESDGCCHCVCVGKTKTAFIIAKGTKDAQFGEVNQKVYRMVEYLREQNI